MASRFWVAGTGNWSDNTNHWAAGSGGVPNASPPTSSDDVYFDANSFSGAGQTVTVDTTASAKTLNWTGATNNPTLALTGNILYFYGDVTFIAAMTITRTTGSIRGGGTASRTVRTNGLDLLAFHIGGTGGTVALLDALVASVSFTIYTGSLNTGNFNITTGVIADSAGAAVRTLALGTSTITCSSWTITGTGITITGTATINCSGNFAGGGLTTYPTVNLGAVTTTITGNNAFGTLGVSRVAGARTITATGTTQTVRRFISATSGTNVLTITNGTWVNLPGIDNAQMDYVTVSGSTASPANTWYAGAHGVDGGGNSGWLFAAGTKIKGGVLMALGIVK